MARLSVQLFDELVISYGAGEERKGKCFIVQFPSLLNSLW